MEGGTRRLVKIEVEMNVAMYRGILHDKLLQSTLHLGIGRRFILQQDKHSQDNKGALGQLRECP